MDRNGRVLAGKGVASSVGIVPGKLEDRDEAIQQIAELLEIEPEVIEKKLSAKWVKEDSFVPIKTIPKVSDIITPGISSNFFCLSFSFNTSSSGSIFINSISATL